MALIHSEIILAHEVCDFIPTKYSAGLVKTHVVEKLTGEQTEVKIAVWNFTGVVKPLFVFVSRDNNLTAPYWLGLVLFYPRP